MPSSDDIICFGKDWHEPKTSNNHVMEELAKSHRVLWVNPLPMRNPNLASAHDLRKIWRKLRGWSRSIEQVSKNLRVLSPVLVPLPHSARAQQLNQLLVTSSVRWAARRWGFRQPQLWIFPPNAVDFVGRFKESVAVSYCTDEWSQFTHLNASFMRDKEAALMAKTDVMFVTSQRLLETKSAHHPNVHLIPHGVNLSLFGQALSSTTVVPAELAVLPKPVIGFYGNIYDWVDQQLLVEIARQRPSWSLVLVGKVMTDISRLGSCPNVKILGARPYEELPLFCKGFDVGIIPYKTRDARMQTVNPLKLREYLAAGLPVVSSDLPEVRQLSRQMNSGSDVWIAEGSRHFISQIEQAMTHASTEARHARSRRMESESWAARVRDIQEKMAGITPKTDALVA